MSQQADLERRQLIAGLVVVGVLALVGYLLFGRPHIRGGPVGPLSTSCRQTPAFAKANNVPNAVFDTSKRGFPGLVLYDANDPNKAFQMPSWKTAGNLGPLAVGDHGFLFVAPVPNINTLINPPTKQNTIYQVDPQSGDMSEYYSLPHVPLPDQTNPYGILSLAFDCQTNVLYASTISGSRADKPKGAIVAIDTSSRDSPKEIARLENVDVLSLGIFRDKGGARLYYGLANRSEVWRIGLSGDGTFAGKAQKVFDYDQFNELKPRKLVFDDAKTLKIHTTEFRYNLIASTEFRQDIITYTYNASNDTWSRTSQ